MFISKLQLLERIVIYFDDVKFIHEGINFMKKYFLEELFSNKLHRIMLQKYFLCKNNIMLNF